MGNEKTSVGLDGLDPQLSINVYLVRDGRKIDMAAPAIKRREVKI
jgi:hypothetical protein